MPEAAHLPPASETRTIPPLPAEPMDRYADLLVRIGVNLQPGQCLNLRAELEHADFARRVVAAAYRHGAKYVNMVWTHDPITRARLLNSAPEDLDYVPGFEVERLRQALDERWAALSLVGPEHPDLLGDVEPALIRRAGQARRRMTKFYGDALMANTMQWCVAAVPTRAWARQIFPGMDEEEAVVRLWELILTLVRADLPDPIAAWQEHDARLSTIAAELMRRGVRSLHFLDPTPGPDGKPSTDFVVGLTDAPVWVAASSRTPAAVRFLPNMPTEEIFTTPHNLHCEGYVRTSKPCFPFERRVEGALFRFKDGEVVEFDAALGRDVLAEMFDVRGMHRLGEIALVDERSPVNRSGVTFFETLFDENCVCHMAFGEAYVEGVRDASTMTEAEKRAMGINEADMHFDFMIGTPTMQVTGVCADGRVLPVLVDGMFSEALTAPAPDEEEEEATAGFTAAGSAATGTAQGQNERNG